MSMTVRENDVNVQEIVETCKRAHVETAAQKVAEAQNALFGIMGGKLPRGHEVRRALMLVSYALDDALDEME